MATTGRNSGAKAARKLGDGGSGNGGPASWFAGVGVRGEVQSKEQDDGTDDSFVHSPLRLQP